MNFYMPVKVFQERDCVSHHGEELAALGQKAVIVTGRNSSRKNGALEDVEKVLCAYKIPYVIYDEIEENPSIETVMKAREYACDNGADYVIGVGGGSALDASKAIALMMANPKRSEDLLYAPEPAKACKVAAIPTTCGTGSEITPYSVLTIHEKRTKASIPHRIFPEVALVDARYLQSAKPYILANTAVDALSHLIESFCNKRATDYSRMACSYGLDVWARSKDVILGRKKADSNDFENLMCASSMAGFAITHTGTTLPHGMSYHFTYEKHIAHGRAVGVFLAAFLKRTEEKDRTYVLYKLGMDTCEELHAFVTEAVGSVEAADSFIEESVEQMMQNTAKYASAPFAMTPQVLREMFQESCMAE